MGFNTSKLADSVGVGICSHSSHSSPISTSGIVIESAQTVTTEKLGVGRITDTFLTDCGHTGIIITGSSTVTAEGLDVAYLTSLIVGDFVGILVTGAKTVTNG